MLNRTILTVAVATAVSTIPAVVSAASLTTNSDMEIFGRAHLSVDSLDNGGDYSEMNMSSNSSRLGFKGSTDFGAVTGIYKVAQEIYFDQGKGKAWASRDTYAGVKGGFGMLRLGRFDTPFKKARGPANFFGDQVGDLRNMTRNEFNFDDRATNAVHFQTPDMGGLQFNAAYQLNSDDNAELVGDDEDESPDETVTSLSATYASGPLSVAFANETWGENTATYDPDNDGSDEYDGNGDSTGNRVAVSYDLMSALTLAGFYQSLTDNNDYDDDNNRRDNTVTGFGAQFKLDPQTYLRGHYFTRTMGERDDADSSMMAVGVEHRLDSALRVYANYATVDNDDNASLTPWTQARTASPAGADGETATGISLGMRYDF